VKDPESKKWVKSENKINENRDSEREQDTDYCAQKDKQNRNQNLQSFDNSQQSSNSLERDYHTYSKKDEH
jgi:hypothetical protein